MKTTIAKFDGMTAGGGDIRKGQPIQTGREYNPSTREMEEGWVVAQIARPVQAKIHSDWIYRTIAPSDNTADVFPIDLRQQGSIFCSCQTPTDREAALRPAPVGNALQFNADSDAAVCPVCGQRFEFLMSLDEANTDEAQAEISRKANTAYAAQSQSSTPALSVRASEIRAFWQEAYVDELTERLLLAAENGTLDSVLDGDTIDGSLLNSVDQNAFNATGQRWTYESESEDMQIALEQPECYEGIDFLAIIEKARAAAGE